MAATVAAKRLSEAHRLAQARLGAETVRDLLSVFPLLDPADLNATTASWLRAAVPIVRQRRRSSATLAANYLNTFRILELGDVPPVAAVLADTITTQQLTASLVVTGPVALKQAVGRGVLVEQALRAAQATSARAGMRHALNGGRETTIRTLDSDRIALGWARKVSGNPCAFCAMLASRGPVYRSEAIAQRVGGRSGFDPGQRGDDVQARAKGGRFTNRLRDSGLVSTKQQRGGRQIGESYHDSCHCTVEPIYSPDADWPEGSRQYADLWFETKTRAGSGSDDISDFTAFRQALEGRA